VIIIQSYDFENIYQDQQLAKQIIR